MSVRPDPRRAGRRPSALPGRPAPVDRARAGDRVVAEATNGVEALQALADHQPDILLLDLSMPVLDGLGVLAAARRDHPRVGLLVLTMHGEESIVLRALATSAHGLVRKDADFGEVIAAIRMIVGGGTWIESRAAGVLLEDYRRLNALVGRSAAGRLSEQDITLLRLLAAGHSNKEISAALGLAEHHQEPARRPLRSARRQRSDPGGPLRLQPRHPRQRPARPRAHARARRARLTNSSLPPGYASTSTGRIARRSSLPPRSRRAVICSRTPRGPPRLKLGKGNVEGIDPERMQRLDPAGRRMIEGGGGVGLGIVVLLLR